MLLRQRDLRLVWPDLLLVLGRARGNFGFRMVCGGRSIIERALQYIYLFCGEDTLGSGRLVLESLINEVQNRR